MERKWFEVTFYLRPHLLEYVNSLCGHGPLVLDPYHIIGLTASTCLKRTKQPGNGAIRAGRVPLTFRLSRRQWLDYGRYTGNRDLVAFERSVQLLLQRELLAYVSARRARETALPAADAIHAFLDERNISVDHLDVTTLYRVLETEDQRTARLAYKRHYHATAKQDRAAA